MYSPYAGFCELLRPSLVLVAETEIWPNLFREAKRTGAALAIVNGVFPIVRFLATCRYQWFFRAFCRRGCHPRPIGRNGATVRMPWERPQIGSAQCGNLKYDFEARTAAADSPSPSWLARVHPEKVWIAASTVRRLREDDAVITAFPRQRPGPRVDSGAAQARTLRRRRAKTRSGRHPLRPPIAPDAQNAERVLLLDSIGELGGLFAFADVVFMGGTLAERGGHNILEPALFAKPVIVGPHMENFQTIADQFRAADAFLEIPDAAALPEAVAVRAGIARRRGSPSAGLCPSVARRDCPRGGRGAHALRASAVPSHAAVVFHPLGASPTVDLGRRPARPCRPTARSPCR